MNKYQLICKKESAALLRELLKANHIDIVPTSPYVICEDGVSFEGAYELLIHFKKEKISALLALLKDAHPYDPPIIMGVRDGNYVLIDISDIAFFNAHGNDTFANTIHGIQYKVKYKLYELADEVLPKSFIRINKSEIINIKHILKIIPMFKGKLILKMQGFKEPVDISRNYSKAFKERIGMS